ncbi:MAG: hypothetical protein JNL79_35390 [Myxococcales bacterium]|nr:hypothetical protein [Myxococcales bacterium]
MRTALALLSLSAAAFVGPARAGDPPGPPQPPCVVSGKNVDTLELREHEKGGPVVVILRGTHRWLEVSGFSTKPTALLRVKSGTKPPTLLVDLWVEPATLALGAAKDLEVVPKALAIRATAPLFVREDGGLRARARSPYFVSVEAGVACTDLRITQPTAAPALPQGGELRFAASKSLALRPSASAKVAYTLQFAKDPHLVPLTAYETVTGRVHVRYSEDLLLDAWVDAQELEAPGLGGLVADTLGFGGLGAWGTSASSYYASKDTEVRLGPSATAPLVGTLVKGAAVVRWNGGVVNGWQQVRIREADADPPKGKEFFVLDKDLSIKPP